MRQDPDVSRLGGPLIPPQCGGAERRVAMAMPLPDPSLCVPRMTQNYVNAFLPALPVSALAVPPAHGDSLSPPCSSALAHLIQNFLCRQFLCITWRRDTCRTRWVPKSSHPPCLRAPFHSASGVSMLAVPSDKMPQSSSDPVDHPIPQPALSIRLPSYFPTSGIYLHHTHCPNRLHHWKFGIFFSGKRTDSRAGGTSTPPSQNLCEDSPISSSLQMIMWPLVLSGVIGNIINVAANYVLLYVFHLGVT